MRRIILSFLTIGVSILVGVTVPVMAAEKIVDLNTCWQPEHETFIPWYANQKGWDKEEGFKLKLHYFDSGMAQLEALPAKQWVLGGMGGVPMVVGAMRYGSYLIGVGNDESITNVVMVRADSPVMKVKGFNKQYPEVYGSPDDVKGKTILCTTVSSGHYAMSNWLKVLGLKDKDVVIKNMDQAQAVAAFESGVGDAVALWAPHLYNGLNKGWKIAADVKMCGAALPIILIGDKEYCDKNPEMVAKFLRMYFRGINAIKKEGEKLLPEYKRFYKDWAGMEMSDDMAKKDLLMHPVFTYQEQLKLFDSSKGVSTVESWQQGILDFFTEQGRFKPEEKEKVMKTKYVNDKFLKMVKQPIP
ncbi:MAG: ABC-type nitrate/sulfonate/bicarbonate transport system periplasmic component-like protein [Deltaproteobacteria bacterium]|jgi:NitT/TauT family transport system substrate-binding protein/sulfonate transport system substrate-binding protein|nr:ABC-type nitrate/sulfonate/bicarbonate transport system periplasmic component-like protein [Deltaproteobacteria bacterium]